MARVLVTTQPPANPGPQRTTEPPPSDESVWKILSDAIDEVLGVKNKPERLLKLANLSLAALFCTSLALFGMTGSPPASLPKSSPVSFSLTPSGIVAWSKYKAQQPGAVRNLLVGYLLMLVLLIFLVNCVGAASIRAEREKGSRKEE